MRNYTVSEAARKISKRFGRTVPPHLISNLFYRRELDDLRCPIVRRVRLIPEDYLPVVEAAVLKSMDKAQPFPSEESEGSGDA